MAVQTLTKLCLVLSLAIGALAQNASNPVVDLGYARYAGSNNTQTGITTWFGMRYAASPTGNNRWRAPLPIERFGGYNRTTVLDATTQGPMCANGLPTWPVPSLPIPPGTVIPPELLAGDENCLTVDVLVPNKPVSNRLPVVVEIHGGGFTLGSASVYTGYAMVNQSRGNLIFVQMQYRLGAFGFLSSSEIQANGTANAGLLDQRLALSWVQNHISAFGGDPSQVTIHGGSAGGSSVALHMAAYGGRGPVPFRAAIAEYPFFQPFHNETVLEFQYRQMLQHTNCSSLTCLRQAPYLALVQAEAMSFADGYYGDGVINTPKAYGYGDFYYGPTVDGTVVRELPSQAFKGGRVARVPFLTNRETYEGDFFTNTSVTTQEVDPDFKQFWPAAPQSFFDQLDKLYPVSAYPDAFNRSSAIYADAIINCPTEELATALVTARQPTWKQIFNAGSQIHSATMPFLFGQSASGTIAATSNSTLAVIMKDWFISFATRLDPNAVSYSGISKPNWPQYGSSSTVLNVNQSSITAVTDVDRSAKCAFFQSQGAVLLN